MELQHHGIKGMRWGVRRFQKKDGSLTPSGQKRYSDAQKVINRIEGNAKAHSGYRGAKDLQRMADKLKKTKIDDLDPKKLAKYEATAKKIIEEKNRGSHYFDAKDIAKMRRNGNYWAQYFEEPKIKPVVDKNLSPEDALASLGSNPRKRNPESAADAIGKESRKRIEDTRSKVEKAEMEYEDSPTSANRQKYERAEDAFYDSYRSVAKSAIGVDVNDRGVCDSDSDNKRLQKFLIEVNKVRWTED